MKSCIKKILIFGLSLFFGLPLCLANLEAIQNEAKVAVLPFDISSAGSFSYVGPAAEEVLSSTLALDGISILDHFEIRRITGKKQGVIFSSSDAVDIAKKLKADYIVTGKIMEADGNITVDMDLLQANSKSPLVSLVFSSSSLDKIPPRIENFAKNAANYIMKGPESTATDMDVKGQKIPQEPLQKEQIQDKDIIMARMHPDLLIRQSTKESESEWISLSSNKESYTQKLPAMPPEPLPIPAEEDEYDLFLPDYPPSDESLHSLSQVKQVEKEKKGWLSWIKNLWGSEDASEQSKTADSSLPYPPPEITEEEVASTAAQKPRSGEPVIPSDGPIWQWY
jgi:TolB-like protein